MAARFRPTGCAGTAHLVGICGSGMKALAELLSGLGWNVTGSDLQRTTPGLSALKRRGLRLHHGHDSRFLPADCDVVVYSPAIGASNPERRHAERLGIPQISYSEALGWLMRERVGVSIAGTHGKSTTTAMTAGILTDAGLSPSAVIGAELCSRHASGWAGDGDLLVVESCEYRKNFLHLTPKLAVILGIEPDHFDCFGDLQETTAAFSEFAAQMPGDGILLVRGDCASTMTAARAARAKVVTFSDRPGADWWAADLKSSPSGSRFRMFYRGQFFSEIELQIPGRHNQLNALAAAALSHYAGASSSAIRRSLREFRGIRRRFEEVGSWRGVTLVDDYAHHPTAVAATLQTARQRFGDRRIWCAFQPHQISRTRALAEEFAGAFQHADQTLVAPVFAARETVGQEPQLVAAELAGRIAARQNPARYCPSLDHLKSTLEDEARPGDVLITMGAGDIDRVHHELTRRIPRHPAPR